MEKVKFQNSRGLKLVGNFWEAESDAGVVLSHGFTGSKEQYGKLTEVAEKLNSEGFNVLAFDFSGCGESEDDAITVEGEVDDLNSAIDYIKLRVVNRIGLFGLSQGGWITLKTYKQRKNEISTLVLLAPLTDALPNYGKRKYSEEQRRELQEEGEITYIKEKGYRDEYRIPQKLIKQKENLNQDELLSGVDCPVLFIHGTEDTSVPIKQSKQAVQKLEDAGLKEIQDNHYWENSVSKVAKLTTDWYKERLSNNL